MTSILGTPLVLAGLAVVAAAGAVGTYFANAGQRVVFTFVVDRRVCTCTLGVLLCKEPEFRVFYKQHVGSFASVGGSSASSTKCGSVIYKEDQPLAPSTQELCAVIGIAVTPAEADEHRDAMEAAGLSEMRVPMTRFEVCHVGFFSGLISPTVVLGARRVYRTVAAMPWYPHVQGAMEIFKGSEITYYFSLDMNEAFSPKREAKAVGGE
ncbi:hypothetical protein T492DRAFT_1130231 [Pavlovales sp. CCMP2436]|nr:hypothetical protein T492DRAFT_1130231 [Pavlovales sp. CCMP2436]